MKIKTFSLATNIFIGLVLGIACGLFFGDICEDLKIVGQGFIKLLQMTILPYIMVSLVLGIGSLSYKDAKQLALKGSILLGVFWGAGLAMILAMAFIFPNWSSGAFFSTSIVEPPKEIDFLSLYIPSNPFNAMANNIIPAVVLFSLCVGTALIGVKKKKIFLHNLSILAQTLVKITRVIVNLTPIGVFAISAGAVGTMSINEFERLQVYFVAYILAALIMTFFVLPVIVMALTSFKYGEIVNASKDALLTGFTTGNLFIVLPLVERNIKELFEKHNKKDKETDALIDIITPVYFNFPDTGKLLSLIFILFAAWFSGAPMPGSQYPVFAVTGFFTFFGGADIAIPFLLKTFQLPSDLFHLYIVSGILNGRFSTLLAVMDLFAFSLLCTCALMGMVKVNMRKIVSYSIVTVTVVCGILLATKFTLTMILKDSSVNREMFASMKTEKLTHTKILVSLPSKAPDKDDRLPALERIRKYKKIRVGYNPDSLPFVYYNARDNLVGYDVAMAQKLAEELGCTLELLPFNNDKMLEQLNAGYFDIIMSGVTVTIDRLEKASFSNPYMTLTFALIVFDYEKEKFSSQKKLTKMKDLRIAVLKDSIHLDMIKKYLPNAKILQISQREDFFTQNTDCNALMTTAEEGAAWALIYPEYGVVVPTPLLLRINAAYPVRKGDFGFVNFMNHWLEMQKINGFIKTQYDYWLLGIEYEKKEPHWSILRNVLGWSE